MGQKVHPIGIRLGVVKRHNANWYASPKQYAEYLLKDLQVREFLTKKLKNAMISNILIERPTGAAKITISTARPGIVIGKKGEDIEKLQRELTSIMGVPAMMEVTAKLRGAAISAQKTRLVADLIRGKSVAHALNILNFSNKKAAVLVKKALESAIANAEHNNSLDVDDLKVSTIYVDEGTSLKRIMPRAKGRADRITKRTCHITVKVGV